MYRNLNARVEVIVPIEGRPLRERLWEIVQIMRRDRRSAWDMGSDGRYRQRTPPDDPNAQEALGTHLALMNLARRRGVV
ncbi:MAG: hypothetical protein M5U26_03860 [Planctomycetota bacterium]|nr:hypothetical protein [Planctomycetota bacterium]